MTSTDLQAMLETVPGFVLQSPFPPITYRFRNGKLYKEGKELTAYSLSQGLYPGHFKMQLNDSIEDNKYIFHIDCEDIIVNIDGKEGFPIYLNSNPLRVNRKFVILQAQTS